jgi:hypothetical protein
MGAVKAVGGSRTRMSEKAEACLFVLQIDGDGGGGWVALALKRYCSYTTGIIAILLSATPGYCHFRNLRSRISPASREESFSSERCFWLLCRGEAIRKYHERTKRCPRVAISSSNSRADGLLVPVTLWAGLPTAWTVVITCENSNSGNRELTKRLSTDRPFSSHPFELGGRTELGAHLQRPF